MRNYDMQGSTLLLERSLILLSFLECRGLPVGPIIEWSLDGWKESNMDFINEEMNKCRILYDTFIDGSHGFDVLEYYFNSFCSEGILTGHQAWECIARIKRIYPVTGSEIYEFTNLSKYETRYATRYIRKLMDDGKQVNT